MRGGTRQSVNPFFFVEVARLLKAGLLWGFLHSAQWHHSSMESQKWLNARKDKPKLKFCFTNR